MVWYRSWPAVSLHGRRHSVTHASSTPSPSSGRMNSPYLYSYLEPIDFQGFHFEVDPWWQEEETNCSLQGRKRVRVQRGITWADLHAGQLLRDAAMRHKEPWRITPQALNSVGIWIIVTTRCRSRRRFPFYLVGEHGCKRTQSCLSAPNRTLTCWQHWQLWGRVVGGVVVVGF